MSFNAPSSMVSVNVFRCWVFVPAVWAGIDLGYHYVLAEEVSRADFSFRGLASPTEVV